MEAKEDVPQSSELRDEEEDTAGAFYTSALICRASSLQAQACDSESELQKNQVIANTEIVSTVSLQHAM